MNTFNIKANNIKKMKIVGKLASEVLEMIKPFIVPNITTDELNNICHTYIIKQQKAIPACLGYHGFPKSICISINNIACHGIPNKKKKIKNGDIINIDVTILKNKFYADTSKMFIVNNTSKIAQKLCKVAKKSLYITFPIIKPGIPLYKIGKTIQQYVNTTKFSIVEEYCGHGIGKNFHQKPYILHHYIKKNNTTILKEGMIFTIEPIINIGDKKVVCMSDGWSIKTQDNSLSAQYEHTILVTKYGCEILTKRKNEKIKKQYINV